MLLSLLEIIGSEIRLSCHRTSVFFRAVGAVCAVSRFLARSLEEFLRRRENEECGVYLVFVKMDNVPLYVPLEAIGQHGTQESR